MLVTSYRLELSVGFLSRSPQTQREWLSLRLLSISRMAELSLGVPCSSVVLEDVPFDVARGAGLGSRPRLVLWDSGDWGGGRDQYVDLSHPLSLVAEGDTGSTVTRPFPEVSGPAVSLSSRWNVSWVGDWEAGAGVVRPFWFEVTPEGFSPAQLEVLSSLHSNGMALPRALLASLAIV